MPTYIVTYDLNKEVNRPNMAALIKKIYPDWAKLSESSYAINTASDPASVYSSLTSLLDSNDNLYVITLTRRWYGKGPSDVNNWLVRSIGTAG
jgi:CRISPR/Cas system-associated endoribonuclease Cas2